MIKDKHISQGAKATWKCLTLQLGTTANSQTAKLVDSTIPTFAFQIVGVEVNALTVTSTFTVDVQITGVTALTAQITPVAATPTVGTLSSTVTALRGSATDSVQVYYTSGGSGAATNGVVRVWIRPVPLNNEVYYV